MKKQKIVYLIMVLLMFSTRSFAFDSNSNSESVNVIDDETIRSQQESFGISSFIENAEKYSSDFFGNTSISDILNSAIKGDVDNKKIYEKILNVVAKETKNSVKGLISILAIIVIHSILKAISDSLDNNNISSLIFYVQYIAIVTIIMVNFSDIISIVRDTTTNLVGFINMLIPILVTLMLYTGSISTSTILEPIILFMINFVGNLIQDVLIPIVLVIASISIISKISDKVQVEKIAKFLKSSTTWFLGIILTIFVGVISLEGTLSSSIDGITSKTTKSIVSSAIPVVGKILGDAVDTVLGCGLILKNAVGIVGVIIIIGICVTPIIKLGILTISYNLITSLCEPIADKKIVELLVQMADIFKILLAILSSISVMIIIGTTLVIKISNSGMMYR